MSQSCNFKSRPDFVKLGGVGGEAGNLGKTLKVERLGWNMVDRISKCRRYVIDVTILDPLSLRGSSALASLVLLDVLGRWKLVGVSGTWSNWLDKFDFLVPTIWDAEGRGNIRKKDVFLTYEWMIGSKWILIYRRTSRLRALTLNPDRH